MLSFDEARSAILECINPLGPERVELLDSLGAILAEDMIAPWPLPSFDNSAMDGFALRAEDAGGPLPVVAFIPAGARQAPALQPGTAIRIMTGGMMPAGSNCVVPIEDAAVSDGLVQVTAPVKAGQHIRRAGEDVREGETVLPAGSLVRPYEVNMLACFGQKQVSIVRRPRVAIVATGDELVPLGSRPGPGQVVNSNSHALAAAVSALGCRPRLTGIARDTAQSHRQLLAQGLEQADVLITSAGVSVGDRDFVRETLADLGVEIVFWKVKVKPGKALAFGMAGSKPVFGLPGNPVSTMLTFDEFVAPALLRMMGHSHGDNPLFQAVLQHDLKKSAGRTQLVRLHLEYSDGRFLARSAGKQETGMLKTLLHTNAVAILPAERESFAAGESISVHLCGFNPGALGL
jgi:molybdopterin molybdotransferase